MVENKNKKKKKNTSSGVCLLTASFRGQSSIQLATGDFRTQNVHVYKMFSPDAHLRITQKFQAKMNQGFICKVKIILMAL